ncbi:MAG: enoyl-CoA hydratase/isomerase family protein [Candidatus Abyssobacteria bacterium SURF_5]|uniref:Enoyl-CoA hydratase/isomerase family protein n=1 Tax=Abyssobacteria bacterium (strain SURF_5) TaxID=2093360 RepID=A0A3A4P4J1_ABYX5|nr:MAG: enoyl-CoA hydratase/isomerase family protein [Candidatus Abyssubacteria bacterium SURF_5]
MSSNFLVEERDSICTITINRPDRRNSFTLAMWKEFTALMRSLNHKNHIHAVIIRGAGEKSFSSGIDLAELASTGRSITDPSSWEDIGIEEAMHSITEFRYPVIAMVNGYAIAGGCELALHCDILIAADTAKFAMPLAKIGLLVPFPLAQRLVNAVGVTYAREMLYTGRMVSAAEAKQMGMVNEVVPLAQLQERVQAVAGEIAANAPLSLEGMKKTLSRCFAYEQKIDFSDLREHMGKCLSSEDVIEGITAFIERRKPVFKGK